MTTTFELRINGGEAVAFVATRSAYSLAVMEAFGRLALPYPCEVEIWAKHLVPHGYSPMRFTIDDNEYGHPSVMSRKSAPS